MQQRIAHGVKFRSCGRKKLAPKTPQRAMTSTRIAMRLQRASTRSRVVNSSQCRRLRSAGLSGLAGAFEIPMRLLAFLTAPPHRRAHSRPPRTGDRLAARRTGSPTTGTGSAIRMRRPRRPWPERRGVDSPPSSTILGKCLGSAPVNHTPRPSFDPLTTPKPLDGARTRSFNQLSRLEYLHE